MILYLLGVSLSSLGVSDASGEGRLKFSAISIEYSEDGVMLGRIFSRLSTKVTFVTATCFLLSPIVSESSQVNLVEPLSAQKDSIVFSHTTLVHSQAKKHTSKMPQNHPIDTLLRII